MVENSRDSAFTAFGELNREVGKLRKGERPPELSGYISVKRAAAP